LVQGDPLGSVFTVENGVVHRRPVLYQARADGRIDVLQGLEAGTEVVVSGSRVLRDGVPVVLSSR